MENEIFVECRLDARYLIGNYGTLKRIDPVIIRRYKTDKPKGLVKDNGYKLYWIGSNWQYAHRLVAMHFVDNPRELNEVNHINGIKGNNHASNLEWCTHKENIRHSYDVLGRIHPSGFNSPLKGRKMNIDSKLLMSDAKIGCKHPRFKGWYCFDGVRYESSYAMSIALGRSNRTYIRWCKLGLNGYTFESNI